VAGFVPDDIWWVPHAAVLRRTSFGVFPRVLEQYGWRAQARSDHLNLVLRYLDWKPVPAAGEPLRTWSSSCWTGRWSTTPRPCGLDLK
jgi:hypothetical protein